MKLFSAKREKKNIRGWIVPVILLLALIFLVRVSDSVSDTNRAQEKELLSRALERSITQCYALEGDYPPNLNYLKENYGLTYDSDRYFVDYQYIGSNLRPDTTIIERN